MSNLVSTHKQIEKERSNRFVRESYPKLLDAVGELQTKHNAWVEASNKKFQELEQRISELKKPRGIRALAARIRARFADYWEEGPHG